MAHLIKSSNEMFITARRPGERPDTVVVHKLPCKWFDVKSEQGPGGSDLLRELFGVLGFQVGLEVMMHTEDEGVGEGKVLAFVGSQGMLGSSLTLQSA